MTYNDLEIVNSEIKTIDLKGKNYAEVAQRVQAFRKLFPEGFIKTDIVKLDGEVCIIKASVGMFDAVKGEDIVLATGTAYEKEGSSFINKTSYIENCETSAVGRALGMLGIGSESSIRSAEEELNASLQQEAQSTITSTMLKAVRESIKNNDLKEEKIVEFFKLKKLEDMNVLQMRQFNEMVEKSKDEKKKEAKKEAKNG